MGNDSPHLTNAELAERLANELRTYEGINSPHLTNAELAVWAANELRRDEKADRFQNARTQPSLANGPSYQENKQAVRMKAIIAGQEVIRRDLPDVALTGDFRIAPTVDGGWLVRYAVVGAGAVSAAANGFVECVVAANGIVGLLRK